MDAELYRKIKTKYALGPASHFIHMDNLPGILQDGLLCHSAMQNKAYVDISDPSVQLGREYKTIPVTETNLHDYVPLYFGPKTPLVVKYQDRNEEFLYLRFSLNILQLSGAVFSDGNARSNATRFFLFNSIDDLQVVDPCAINAFSWVGDDEKKRRKQAEILIPAKIAAEHIFDILCSSETAKQYVMDKLRVSDLNLNVIVSNNWFFKPRVQK